MPDFKILDKKDFIPSTIVTKGFFNTKIDIDILSAFLVITHKFDKNNKRIKLISGTRKGIKYFGPEGCIIFVGYKKIRGMRTGAMNNMVSIDLQYGGKNIHLKISSTSITSVGTNSLEAGKKAVEKILEHIKKAKDFLDYSNSLDSLTKIKNMEWLLEYLKNKDENLRENDIVKNIVFSEEDFINKKFIYFLMHYYDDYDSLENFKTHIFSLKENLILAEKDIVCRQYDIFNSVYHIRPIVNKNFIMPLNKLAPFLASKGVCTSWHNALSESINISFDIESTKEDINHENKYYKHRISIPTTCNLKQSSPTNKEEAYKYYLGTMNLIKEFFTTQDINFKDYIVKNIKTEDIEILTKRKPFKKMII